MKRLFNFIKNLTKRNQEDNEEQIMEDESLSKFVVRPRITKKRNNISSKKQVDNIRKHL